MNVLPESLVHEVLGRLPLLEALRLRCVCKSWKDVILEPGFIRRHQVLNPIPPGVLLTYSEFVQGTMLLNPRSPQPAWTRVPALDCPTNPAGILVAATAGLLCYAISRLNEEGEVIEMDFVIWNPVTNQRNQLPTLHIEAPGCVSTRPDAAMVVRQGRLHQLWVSLFLAVAVFDCFISKEAMQTRIANNGEWMKPLRNSWVAFWLHTGDRSLLYFDSRIIYSYWRSLEFVDVDNFTISTCPWESLDRFQSVTGMLLSWKGDLACVFASDRTLTTYILSALGVVHKGDERLVRSRELCQISKKPRLDVMVVKSTDDVIYMLSVGDGQFLVRLANSTEGCLEVVSMQNLQHPDRCRIVEALEPSLSDSPGCPCDVNFDWDLVKFPEENKKNVWVISPSSEEQDTPSERTP